MRPTRRLRRIFLQQGGFGHPLIHMGNLNRPIFRGDKEVFPIPVVNNRCGRAIETQIEGVAE